MLDCELLEGFMSCWEKMMQASEEGGFVKEARAASGVAVQEPKSD